MNTTQPLNTIQTVNTTQTINTTQTPNTTQAAKTANQMNEPWERRRTLPGRHSSAKPTTPITAATAPAVSHTQTAEANTYPPTFHPALSSPRKRAVPKWQEIMEMHSREEEKRNSAKK